MVNKNILTNRIELIDTHLNRLSAYHYLSRQDFLNDINVQDIVEYNFFQIVNHLIRSHFTTSKTSSILDEVETAKMGFEMASNIIEHIVVDEDYGLPQTAYDAARILNEKGVLNKIIKRFL